jgi:hypothetical protein
MNHRFDKIAIIDLEGDGAKATINQQLFPNGCHLDPDTRIWCATVVYRDETDWKERFTYAATWVCKLPSEPRKYPNPMPYWQNGTRRYAIDTGIYHYPQIQVDEKRIDGLFEQKYIKVATSDYKDFLNRLAHLLNDNYNRGIHTYCKAYVRDGKVYNYDKLLLKKEFDKYEIQHVYYKPGVTIETVNQIEKYDVLDYVEEFVVPVGEWNETHKQEVTFKPDMSYDEKVQANEKFMNNGIQHNIEDSLQLANYIWNKYDVYRKQHDITTRKCVFEEDFK